MKPIRILYVLPNLRICNGMASYAMNYFRNINKEKFKIDFLLLRSIPSPYSNEIEQTGSQIFILPSPQKGIFKYLKALDKVFNSTKYDIVHCNVMNAGAIILKSAKKNRIRIRILHSHEAKSADIKWKEIRNNAIAPIVKYYATNYFACSKSAGDYLFGKKQFYVINNAIDESKFIYNENTRKIVRNKLNLEDNFVIGTVGRFAPSKNPMFIVKVFAELKKSCDRAKLMWIGSGFMEEEIRNKVKSLEINNDVMFMGDRSDVQDLYQAMDVLLFPSIYEGLGIVGIEAQYAGLPVVASDTIPKEIEISNLVTFLSLKESVEKWVEILISYKKNFVRVNVEKAIGNSGYSIKNEAKHIEEIYKDLMTKVRPSESLHD